MLGLKTPLGKVRGLGSARAGTEHFWRQRLTAVANIPLVIAFVLIVVSNLGVEHAVAVANLGHPLVAIVLALTVINVCVHMRIGMQVVIEDYVHDELLKVVAVMANTFFSIAVGVACLFALLKLSFGG